MEEQEESIAQRAIREVERCAEVSKAEFRPWEDLKHKIVQETGPLEEDWKTRAGEWELEAKKNRDRHAEAELCYRQQVAITEQQAEELQELRGQLCLDLGDEIEHLTTHCLDRAAALVCGDRAQDYGKPSLSFESVAIAWQAYRNADEHRHDLDGRDVSNMMVIYKTIRDSYQRKQDNQDDIAGYSQVGSWIGDPRVHA